MTAKQYMSVKVWLQSQYTDIIHQQPTEIQLFQFARYIEMAASTEDGGGAA